MVWSCCNIRVFWYLVSRYCEFTWELYGKDSLLDDQESIRLILCCMIMMPKGSRYALLAYSLPRSDWCDNPRLDFGHQNAICKAFKHNDVRIGLSIDHRDIEPALKCPNIGNISYPDLIGCKFNGEIWFCLFMISTHNPPWWHYQSVSSSVLFDEAISVRVGSE